jgi:hypothetical protein
MSDPREPVDVSKDLFVIHAELLQAVTNTLLGYLNDGEYVTLRQLIEALVVEVLCATLVRGQNAREHDGYYSAIWEKWGYEIKRFGGIVQYPEIIEELEKIVDEGETA